MKVLFICKGNAFRSQIAEAIYNKLTNSTDAFSAGTYVGAADEPEGTPIEVINGSNDFVEMMQEKGFDLCGRKTVRLTPDMVSSADKVFCMAEEPYIPEWLKNNSKVIFWDVPDVPDGIDRSLKLEKMEKTYNTILSLVQNAL